MQSNLTTAPETPPVAEKPIALLFPTIGVTAINIAALGRIVRDIAEESFSENNVSDYLIRLSALGACIDRMGQQIAEQVDDYDTPRAIQQLNGAQP